MHRIPSPEKNCDSKCKTGHPNEGGGGRSGDDEVEVHRTSQATSPNEDAASPHTKLFKNVGVALALFSPFFPCNANRPNVNFLRCSLYKIHPWASHSHLNPRPDGPRDFPRPDGGGVFEHPPPRSRLLLVVEKK